MLIIVVVSAAQNPQLVECITSWIKELPLNDIINSPLLKVIFDDLLLDEPFDAAVECLCTIFHETRDVDECMSMIQALYPHVIALRPMLAKAAEDEDTDKFKGLAKIFAEAGTCWVVLIARQPEQLRPLVEGVIATAALDKERDAISYTFNFWYELKQYLTLENFMQARLEFVDIYSKLVDIMISHLEYPKPDGDDEKDLFEGDRELEEKFREFRHQMGDVLKDCCEVIGVTDCLGKSYSLIQNWVQTYGAQATANHVPEWQKLEAPLFSMRAMGRMVPAEESIMLPRLIPLIVQIPDHEKVRFQAVMALGRYTEWTAYHAEDMLQPQLQYIMASFNHPSKEVVRAAALSFKFFCNDCAKQLVDYIQPLQLFYRQHLDGLPTNSQEEITDGVASVLGRLPAEQVLEQLQAYCNPIITSLIQMAQQASNDKERTLVAGIGLRFSWRRHFTKHHCRQNPARHTVRAMGSTTRPTPSGQSRCQILPRDFPRPLRDRRKLPEQLSNSRSSMPVLAVHGAFLPHRHGTPSSGSCDSTRQWILCV
jgi:transportin-3